MNIAILYEIYIFLWLIYLLFLCYIYRMYILLTLFNLSHTKPVVHKE